MGSEQINRETARAKETRSSMGALDWLLALGPLPPCPYTHHRPTDWRLDDGHPWACGFCHPPARGLIYERAA